MSNSNASAPLTIHQKIIKIMEQVRFVTKGASVSTGASGPSYKAVQHDDVTALIHGPATDIGLTIIPEITNVEVHEVIKETLYNGKSEKKISYRAHVWVETEFTNADNPSETFKKKSFAYALDSGDKAIGKAFSMAVKYTYLKAFLLESGDNEESRDNEGFGNQSNQNRNQSNNRNQNYDRNNSVNNGGNQTANTKGTSNDNANKHSGSNQTSGEKNTGQKISQASDNQINAIKKISGAKGLQVGEKFTSKENCSSQEASQEIARLSSIK